MSRNRNFKSSTKGEYTNPSKVTTRKMTEQECLDAERDILQGLKNVYSKFNCNKIYGKEEMPEIKSRIDELEDKIKRRIILKSEEKR